MDPTSRPSPRGHSSVGTPIDDRITRDEDAPFTAPLVLQRRSLPCDSGGGGAPLREQHITAGSADTVKPSASFMALSAKPPTREATVPAMDPNPSLDPAKPVFDQIARLGALRRQVAQARGQEAAPTLSAWQQGLATGTVLRRVYAAGLKLFPSPPSRPPSPADRPALEAQALASQDLDPGAPLPDRDAMQKRLSHAMERAGAPPASSAASLLHRFDRIGYHLEGLADLSNAPLDRADPGRQTLRRLGALEQEIHRLLGDKSAPVPQRLRAELTLLGARVRQEQGFAQQAQAFARQHDTADLNFEGITAFMRHGFTSEQLHFLLFMQSLHAAYRASFDRGSPLAVPQDVADSYQGLWKQLGACLREAPAVAGGTPASIQGSTASTSQAAVDDDDFAKRYSPYIPESAQERGRTDDKGTT